MIRQQLSLMRALLPVSPGAAAAPGLLATALRRRERDAIEILFCSLLQDCCPSVRARVLVEDFDGTPLIAQLISLYPGCIARVLNEKALGLKTAWEIVGDRPSCESFVLCTNVFVSHTMHVTKAGHANRFGTLTYHADMMHLTTQRDAEYKFSAFWSPNNPCKSCTRNVSVRVAARHAQFTVHTILLLRSPGLFDDPRLKCPRLWSEFSAGHENRFVADCVACMTRLP